MDIVIHIDWIHLLPLPSLLSALPATPANHLSCLSVCLSPSPSIPPRPFPSDFHCDCRSLSKIFTFATIYCISLQREVGLHKSPPTSRTGCWWTWSWVGSNSGCEVKNIMAAARSEDSFTTLHSILPFCFSTLSSAAFSKPWRERYRYCSTAIRGDIQTQRGLSTQLSLVPGTLTSHESLHSQCLL